MVTDVLTTDHLDESGLLESREDVAVDTRKNELNTTGLGAEIELLEVVYTGRIDEGNLTHTDDADLLVVLADATADFIELIGNTEEIGTIDLVHLSVSGDVKLLEILTVEADIVVGSRIELTGERTDDCGFVGTLEEEADCENETHLDSHGKVEDDSEDEGDDHDQEVRLRVLGKPEERTPAGHVVADHDEDASEASHRDHSDKTAEEKEDKHEDAGMNETGNRGASAIVDIGHGAGNGSGSGDTAEERDDEVGNTLTDELSIGVC